MYQSNDSTYKCHCDFTVLVLFIIIFSKQCLNAVREGKYTLLLCTGTWLTLFKCAVFSKSDGFMPYYLFSIILLHYLQLIYMEGCFCVCVFSCCPCFCFAFCFFFFYKKEIMKIWLFTGSDSGTHRNSLLPFCAGHVPLFMKFIVTIDPLRILEKKIHLIGQGRNYVFLHG